jgi:hypothetical protein
VVIGSLFTAAGIVTLLVPAIPFICLGALIFGPIELVAGLLGGQRQPLGRAPALAPVERPPTWTPAKFCPACGKANEGLMNFCASCGTRLTDPGPSWTKG